LTITNTAPDQTVVLTAGTGINTSGTYPSFTITNSAPDQTVALTAGTGISTSGTYPNFTITNSAPDQTVALTQGGTTTITGTYPNFTISSADQFQGTVTSVAATVPAFLSITGSPVTTTGTLAIGLSGTALPVLNGGTGVTTSTGTTNVVLSNSPTLVTPALGTPSALVGTNITGTATAFNINGTVGATTPASGAFTTLSATGVTTVQAGTAALPAITTTGDTNTGIFFPAADTIAFSEGGAEAMRIDSSGNLLVGRTTGLGGGEIITAQTGGSAGIGVNRQNDDGNLVNFYQAGTIEGNISVSGTTVSYNGGHLSRWAQTTAPKDESIVKGTVLSNLDEMNVYTDTEGNSVQNEQLNKVKVSDVEGDANVAGVFVNWSYDDQHSIDEINMAMTGDMIIRIAQGTTVQRGDLLMSAGDGTAKPQGDDIIRSKTVAKVISTNVTCTYADGSFCVPCVLMAC
jgi:hypothetical protein